MVDITAIGGALGGLKTATDLLKGMQALKTDTEVRQKTSDLLDSVLTARSQLIEAQEAQSALLGRIRELEAEVARLKAWSGEKERYQLHDVGRGAFAYVLKPEERGSEPPHWLCTRCFDEGHRSLLQNQGPAKDSQYAIYGCPRCKNAMHTHWRRKPAHIGDLSEG